MKLCSEAIVRKTVEYMDENPIAPFLRALASAERRRDAQLILHAEHCSYVQGAESCDCGAVVDYYKAAFDKASNNSRNEPPKHS